ncbi:unnamed protein product [Strongylus vulgaris]|uniref:Receptor ligand binding region domain-containing protein n=1 Tax=Strongylus vulgaris TaxID=40348 RepID=A0A3P7JG88_STRVU|nr:unnamed protein product [Strongylus vulgaris]
MGFSSKIFNATRIQRPFDRKKILLDSKANMTITYNRQLQNYTNNTFKNVLKAIKSVSRVTVVCLESADARRNMYIAIAEEGMNTNEYVYLLLDNRKLGFNEEWKLQDGTSDGKDSVALSAAKKFFVIDSQPLNSSDQFVTDVIAKIQQPPFNCIDCSTLDPDTIQVCRFICL